MKLLLDENLSATLAIRLCEDEGIDAVHVRDRDMLGASDEEVFEKGYAEDRIVVTINARDFVKLARATEVHPGLVLLEQEGHDSMSRVQQLECIKKVVAKLRGCDLTNRALRVAADGSMTFEDIPHLDDAAT